MKWVFMSPVFSETSTHHFSQICCEESLVEAITLKREAHMTKNNTKEVTAATEVNPREDVWMDLGGIKPAKTTRFECKLDGLILKVEARDVGDYISILTNLEPSKEEFNGVKYHLVDSFHVSILLSESQCQELATQLEALKEEACRVAE